jgi:hypothetical protein
VEYAIRRTRLTCGDYGVGDLVSLLKVSMHTIFMAGRTVLYAPRRSSRSDHQWSRIRNMRMANASLERSAKSLRAESGAGGDRQRHVNPEPNVMRDATMDENDS